MNDVQKLNDIVSSGKWASYKELPAIAARILNDDPNNPLALMAIGLGCMNALEADKGIEAGKALVKIAPIAESYWILGMNQLLNGESGRAAFEKANESKGDYWRHVLLAKAIENKTDVIEVADFKLPIAVFDGQAIESTLYHIGGELTEEDELTALEKEWETGRRILEIGALIGNHTAFFLKRLQPDSLTIYEMNPICIDYLRKTIFLNNVKTDVEIINEKVTEKSKLPKGDYFKIDIDGQEKTVIPAIWGHLAEYRGGLLEVSAENAFLKMITGTPDRIFEHGGYQNWLIKKR
jgi:hypothetical protein